MRIDNSWPRDLAMSASTNMETGMTYALFHGCDDHDVTVLSGWLKVSAHSAGHPMLLPALFAELQLRRHKRLNQKNWRQLVTLYALTGQYGNQVLGSPPLSSREGITDYANITRDIIVMHQDTGFLEKSHIKFNRTLKRMVAQLAVISVNVPEARKDFMAIEGARIEERLGEIIDDYEGLIEKCKLITEGASLLIGAVSYSCSFNNFLLDVFF